jgi:pyrimidine-nucleoside phosphorylase
MYALRDATGTVESIPLITASIMSKKFAEGAQALLMDVKTGSGAFMKDRDQARSLARSLVATGAGLGQKVAALITDMDQPLGLAVGNFLEVRESVECLQGRGPRDEVDLTVQQVGWMLALGGICANAAAGEAIARARLADGSAWERLLRNVEFQGGNTDVLLHPEKGPRASVVKPVKAYTSGFVQRIDAHKTGVASVILGAGRSRKEDRVLPAVGITLSRTQGDRVDAGDELCLVHGESEQKIDEACRLMESAYTLSDQKKMPGSRLLEEITHA